MVKKTIKYLVYILLTIVVLVNLFILLTGRYYLYSGVAKTYLQGKTGPGIYDLDVFPVNKINKSTEPYRYVVQKTKSAKLTKSDLDYHEEIDTKAFLVFQGDTLIYEKYWDEHSLNQVSNSFSAAKTVIGLLVGIAIEEGKIKSVDDFAGQYIPEFNRNGREKITIRHLLTMSAGFDWVESGSNPLSEAAEGYYGTDLLGLVTRLRVIEKPGRQPLLNVGSSGSSEVDMMDRAYPLTRTSGTSMLLDIFCPCDQTLRNYNNARFCNDLTRCFGSLGSEVLALTVVARRA